MAFVKVDWDDFGRHAVIDFAQGIPRRSTLLVLRGNIRTGSHCCGYS